MQVFEHSCCFLGMNIAPACRAQDRGLKFLRGRLDASFTMTVGNFSIHIDHMGQKTFPVYYGDSVVNGFSADVDMNCDFNFKVHTNHPTAPPTPANIIDAPPSHTTTRNEPSDTNTESLRKIEQEKQMGKVERQKAEQVKKSKSGKSHHHHAHII